MGRAVFSPCCLAWGQTMVEIITAIIVTSFKKTWMHVLLNTLLYSVPLSLWQATVNSHLCQRLLDTHRQVWVSLLWVVCSFLLVPGGHKVLVVLSKSLFPLSCGSSVILVIMEKFCKLLNSTGLQSQIPWQYSIPFLYSQVGKSVFGPRTFLTVWEFPWFNCSVVCGLSAQCLSSWDNSDLLQESLCHTLHDPMCSTTRALVSVAGPCHLCLCKRHSDTQRQFWFSLCGFCRSWCTQAFVWALWTSLVGIVWL